MAVALLLVRRSAISSLDNAAPTSLILERWVPGWRRVAEFEWQGPRTGRMMDR